MTRVLSVDYGTRRLGLAISDPGRIIAQPYRMIANKDRDTTLAEIAEVVRSKEVGEIVMGFPLNDDGSEGTLCSVIRDFSRDLSSRTGLEIHFQDEAYTSLMAEDILREGGRHITKNGDVDRLAAQIILREYLQASHDKNIEE